MLVPLPQANYSVNLGTEILAASHWFNILVTEALLPYGSQGDTLSASYGRGQPPMRITVGDKVAKRKTCFGEEIRVGTQLSTVADDRQNPQLATKSTLSKSGLNIFPSCGEVKNVCPLKIGQQAWKCSK